MYTAVVEQGPRGEEYRPLFDNAREVFLEVDGFAETPQPVLGLTSGFYDIDQLTGGFWPADLVVIGGRTSVGKSALLYDIVLNVARYLVREVKEQSVALFTLDTTKRQATKRFATMLSGLPLAVHLSGFTPISGLNYERFADGLETALSLPIELDDRWSLTPDQVLATCKRIQKSRALAAVAIDSLHLMEPNLRRENRTQEISDIVRALKGIAKELGVPVLVTSELSRIVDLEEYEPPRLSDLRDSGTIEAVADVVMLLHRRLDVDWVEESAKKGEYDVVQESNIRLAKLRHRAPGKADLGFQPFLTRYRNLAR